MNHKIVKYSEIGKIRSGKRLPKGYTVSEKISDNKYIRVRDINSGSIDSSIVQYITDEAAEKLERYKVKTRDVIISVVGTVGAIAQIDESLNGAYLTENCDNLQVDESLCLKDYLKYYLLSEDGSKEIIANTVGSTQPKLPIYGIENFNIKLPSIDNQKRIVKLLNSIDKKIKLNNEINNNLHDLAEQQFNEIYSLGSPKKLDELLFNVSTGSRPKGGAQESGIPSIGAEKIEKFGIYDYSSEKYISEDFYEKLKNGKLNSGDVLLYKDGAYTGKVSMCLNGFPHNKAAVNEHVFILNTENNWAQNYLYFVLYNKDNKEMLHRLASSKAAQPGLNQVELKSIEINICDKDDILKFENSVKPIMEKIALNSLENKRLAELRDTLLPKLMNGEIDLDNIEI